ncbi:AAA domain-containing protein [candidate division WWE3 bacterium]|uniref:AAA domain-containing protein n=1 Tax=candidate division WWE3 bacterium TaxID=2053526 RepID=A0A7X9HSE9_UNCKA|nr:AAA domain-containing protein [candidate division WWE3 bacterium]
MPYSFKLPHKFLAWWATKGPAKAFNIATTFLAVANNELSFLTNIRLLFVPLYGIRTIPGRVMSFVARILMIAVGLLFMTAILIICVLIPIVWLAIPLIIGYYSLEATFIFFVVLYLIWAVSNLNTPERKIEDIKDSKYIKSFRPKTKYYLKLLIKNPKNAINKIIKDKSISYLLRKSELDNKELIEKLSNITEMKTNNIEKQSFDLANENKSRYVELEHLFTSVITNIPNISTILSSFNSDVETIKQTASWIVEEREYLSKVYIWQENYERSPLGGIGKGMLGRVTPTLDKVSLDITKEVQKGRVDRIIGREEEIKQIAEMLDGNKGNILIIGEPGSGKTSILKGIAYRIICGTEYKTLHNKRIVSLDVGSLISGAENAGGIAKRLTSVLDDAEGSGDIILFIDEIQNLVTGLGEKDGDSSTIFSMLENYLVSDKIRFIGATSISNYRKYIEPNEVISRLFQIIELNQSSKLDTIEILKYIARKYEDEYKTFITFPAVVESVELSEELIQERVLPDKAIDILNRSAVSVKESTKILTSEDVAKEVSEMTNVPITTITQDDAVKLLNIESEMKKRVIGQDQALEKVAAALQRARTGIRDEKKPIASFLFVGTTGVGKTETAKALASSYFGNEEDMIRLDMSEYQQLDSINRLIGSPDGSINGTLTDSVRSKPFGLILIDEIEKAHPNILLMFLQVLDEGRLTDTSGNIANFTNSIIICTSNVGTRSIQTVFEAKGTYDQMTKAAMTDIRNKFAPELLNRYTGIIVFNPLSVENMREITKLMLKKVTSRAEEKGIKLSFKPELVEELIKRGYSPQWGARPLARAIEDSVESYLAVKILKKEVKAGDSLLLGTEVFN